MKYLLSIFLILNLIACSGSKSTNTVDESSEGIELADGEEILDEADDFVEDELLDEQPATDSVGESEDLTTDSGIMINDSSPGVEAFHTVVKGETLMIIAFKIYGDYDRWRDLASWNSESLNGNYQLASGMQLKYMTPSQVFTWSPDGNPYLIKKGDTLGTISSATYGVEKHWRDIWDNNKPLIKDPNKIFAGFTIYTPMLESRGVANN